MTERCISGCFLKEKASDLAAIASILTFTSVLSSDAGPRRVGSGHCPVCPSPIINDQSPYNAIYRDGDLPQARIATGTRRAVQVSDKPSARTLPSLILRCEYYPPPVSWSLWNPPLSASPRYSGSPPFCGISFFEFPPPDQRGYGHRCVFDRM
jgi:hypothetical protein